jgi:L-threonate 2-dehydrogenase
LRTTNMNQLSPAQSRIAVIGLGLMGFPIAANLVKAGYNVSGFDPDPTAVARAKADGIAISKDAAHAAAAADIVLTSLPTEKALEETAQHFLGARQHLAHKPITIELSTLSIDAKIRHRDALAVAELAMLDCPISGTGAQAVTRDIAVYASGDEAAFRTCSHVFDAFARKTTFLGAFGAGMKMKLVANLLVAIHNVATAEAINLGVRAGLDPALIYDVITTGAGTSRVFELRGPMMVRNSFEPATMKLDVWKKDIDLIAQFAAGLKASTPIFSATRPLYAEAQAKAGGHADTAAVYSVFDQ